MPGTVYTPRSGRELRQVNVCLLISISDDRSSRRYPVKKGVCVEKGDQADVIAFLANPASYALDEPVEVLQTHGSMVFLAGERAYKLKRAVKYPYMD